MSTDSYETNYDDQISLASTTSAPPPNSYIYYPTINPLDTVKTKSLDFAFGQLSYAFEHVQKHGDNKHATLTITYTNNLLFNGQLLDGSYTLPNYNNRDYAYLSSYNLDLAAAYFCVNGPSNVRNIHSFSQVDGGKSTIGFVSHTYFSSAANYAYILDFRGGSVLGSIYNVYSGSFEQTERVFGGDRLKWSSATNKYLINQWGQYSADDTYTDPIPTATSGNDGLFSKSSYSYVYSQTGYLRTDVDALKKVTQAPCAVYVPLNDFFYTSAPSTVKKLAGDTKYGTIAWDLINSVKHGLQVIGYAVGSNGVTYVTASNAYFGYIGSMKIPGNYPTPSYLSDGRFLQLEFTYRNNNYSSYMFVNKNFEISPTMYPLAYSFAAYVSPMTMQQITTSNEGTFIK